VAAFALAVRFLPVMAHVEEPELAAPRVEAAPLLQPVPVRS